MIPQKHTVEMTDDFELPDDASEVRRSTAFDGTEIVTFRSDEYEPTEETTDTDACCDQCAKEQNATPSYLQTKRSTPWGEN